MFSVNTHLKLSGFERSGIGPGKLETIIRGKFWSSEKLVIGPNFRF